MVRPKHKDCSIKKKEYCTVVLGGHVNGYSVVRELSECGQHSVVLVDDRRSMAAWSNKVDRFIRISWDSRELLRVFEELKEEYELGVVYVTADRHIELCMDIQGHIEDFCYLPFAHKSLIYLDKSEQYRLCEELGIGKPNSVECSTVSDLVNVRSLNFPVLVKPKSQNVHEEGGFRNMTLDSERALTLKMDQLEFWLSKGRGLLISELIPGGDDCIYSYACFKSVDGEILGEWVGRKLSQFPDAFGVFSTATAVVDEDVRSTGRLLAESMPCRGFLQPEFKYDHRDQTLKLMEANLRPMMWHRVGLLAGVRLIEAQLRDALGKENICQSQKETAGVHFIFMAHEMTNVVSRPGYWGVFHRTFFGAKKREWAVLMWSDPIPAMYGFLLLINMVFKGWLKRLSAHW